MAWCFSKTIGFLTYAVLLICCALSPACLDVRSQDLHPDGSVDAGGREGCKECHHNADAEELTRCDGCHQEVPSTGSHPAHIAWATPRAEDACAYCHRVPEKWFDEGHLDAQVQVSFPSGGLASTGGHSPAWNGTSCDDVYCHGASMAGAGKGTPPWSGDKSILCGDCHLIPPKGTHPPSDQCAVCHADGYLEDGTQDPVDHINGLVEMALEEDSP